MQELARLNDRDNKQTRYLTNVMSRLETGTLKHSLGLASMVPDRMVPAAVLHDALEEGVTTPVEVLSNCGEYTFKLVCGMTRDRKSQTYMQYIRSIKVEGVYKDVRKDLIELKLCDIEHNLAHRETPPPGRLAKRYAKALRYLQR